MKKSIFFLLLSFALVLNIFAQDVKKEAKNVETKMDEFASKTGTITKFIDSRLPNLKLYLGEVAETRIRKLVSGNEVRFFYQIEKSGKYSSNTASIEYSDLLEVIKALTILKSDVELDIQSSPDYLENKFTTEDGFQLGYYIVEGKSKWYMRLERYGSDNTLFINDVQTIETALHGAKDKIEQLKN